MVSGDVGYIIAIPISMGAAYAAERIIHGNTDEAQLGSAIAGFVLCNYATTIFSGKTPLEPVKLMATCLGVQLVANTICHFVIEKIRSRWAHLGLALASTPQFIKNLHAIIAHEGSPTYLSSGTSVCALFCGTLGWASVIFDFFELRTYSPGETFCTITLGLAGSCAALLTTTLIATALKVKSPSLSLLI